MNSGMAPTLETSRECKRVHLLTCARLHGLRGGARTRIAVLGCSASAGFRCWRPSYCPALRVNLHWPSRVKCTTSDSPFLKRVVFSARGQPCLSSSATTSTAGQSTKILLKPRGAYESLEEASAAQF
uniref:Uncharacterized protein n=1 Tax=Steinernema glaseri TaxID=37863 RepID=A0A1I7Z3H0_9BILA